MGHRFRAVNLLAAIPLLSLIGLFGASPVSAAPVAPTTATVTFLKTVDNSAGGSAVPGDFHMTLSLAENNGGNQYYSGHSGDTVAVLPGTYDLTEISLPGYTSINGGGCYNTDTQANTGHIVTFSAGENWICGFTNTYMPTATVTPTNVPTGAPTRKPAPSPSSMPDTATGGSGGSGGSVWLFVWIGLILLFVAGGGSLWRARRFVRL
jgi:hypothetical protein